VDVAEYASKAVDQLHEAITSTLAELPAGEWRSIATNIAVPERLAPAVVSDLASTSQTALPSGEVVAWAPASQPGDFGAGRAAWIVNVSWFAAGAEAFIRLEGVVQG